MARAYAEMFSPRPFDLTTFPNDAGYDQLIALSRHTRPTPTKLLTEETA